jgi:hypothetical protein
MRWNNKEAFNLFNCYTSCLANNTPKNTKYLEASRNFIENFELPADPYKEVIRVKFRKLLESKPGNKSTSTEVKTWEDAIF